MQFDNEIHLNNPGTICYFAQMIGFFACYFGGLIYFLFKSGKPEQPSEDQ